MEQVSRKITVPIFLFRKVRSPLVVCVWWGVEGETRRAGTLGGNDKTDKKVFSKQSRRQH